MKIIITNIFVFICLVSVSQTVNVDDIMKYLKNGDAVNAKKYADIAINDNILLQNPKTWYYRAITYHSIFESEIPEVKKLTETSLNEAYNAYIKALELDIEKKYNSDIIKALLVIENQFVAEGVNYFNNKDYNNALNCFENNISINKLPEINQIDTIILYNAALAAQYSGKNNIAINYYEQLIKLQYGDAQICLELAKLYKIENNIPEYLITLQNGLKNYPNNDIILLNELANYYIEINNNDEALNYIEKGLYREPNNIALHFVKGSILEQKDKESEAENEYLTAIKINPDYTDAIFNLAAMYYNKATDILKKTTSKTEQNIAFDYYKKAEPYLSKLETQNPSDVQILKMLKTVYTLLNDSDKLNLINNKLQSIEK